MSPKILSKSLGQALIGALWTASLAAQTPNEPAPPSQTKLQADASSAADQRPQTIHLLTHKRVLKGKLAEYDANTYTIRQKSGSFRFPKADLVQSFSDLESLYTFRREQFPDNDAGEHLKLAQWCLSENLVEQSRDELNEVLAIEPSHLSARAMLDKLDAQEERTMARDDQVVKTMADADQLGPERNTRHARSAGGSVGQARLGDQRRAGCVQPCAVASRPTHSGIPRIRPADPPKTLRRLP